MRGAARALLLALALPGPALALSCLEHDIRAAYWQHADAPDTYVLALGAFGPLRAPYHDTAGDLVIWQATFTGHTASTRGFDQPLTVEVTLEDRLFSAIDGGGDPFRLGRGLPGLTGLVFLRETLGGYVVETALCEPVVDTDPAHVKPALDCLNGRRCPRP